MLIVIRARSLFATFEGATTLTDLPETRVVDRTPQVNGFQVVVLLTGRLENQSSLKGGKWMLVTGSRRGRGAEEPLTSGGALAIG